MSIKYQYIKPTDSEVRTFPKLKGLCITIATELTKIDDKYSHCGFGIAFKNPNDAFNKEAARLAISNLDEFSTFSNTIVLSNDYTRQEILNKILMYIYVNEAELTRHYREYINYILNYTGFISL